MLCSNGHNNDANALRCDVCGTEVFHRAGTTLERGTNRMAIAALVAGLSGEFGVTAVLAVVFGRRALNQIKLTRQGGRDLAIAGIVIGSGFIAWWVYFLIALALQ
jgi:hypothetical protein